MSVLKNNMRYAFILNGEPREIKRFRNEMDKPLNKDDSDSPSFLNTIKNMGMEETFTIIGSGSNIIIIFYQKLEEIKIVIIGQIIKTFKEKWGRTVSITPLYGYETILTVKSPRKEAEEISNGTLKGSECYIPPDPQLLIPFRFFPKPKRKYIRKKNVLTTNSG